MRPFLRVSAGKAGLIIAAALMLTNSAEVVAAPLNGGTDSQPAATSSDEPQPGRALTLAEVRNLYSNRTWVWPGGGGYMGEDGRFLAAGSKDQGTETYATGSWAATNTGHMCFSGVWNTAGQRTYVITCFAHRIEGETIFQRQEPCGLWFAFKSSPVQAGDEFNKIVAGDQVSAKLKRLESSSSAN